MKRMATRPLALLGFATFGAALILTAFLRGNYLLGLGCGAAYVAITVGILWLLARTLLLTKKPSIARATLVAALSIPVGFAMAYPASINPDVQIGIDRQATDREARKELAAVFGSDPAFTDLSISTMLLKVVNVTIHGSMNTRSGLDRLRDRIASECAAVHRCILHWDVALRDPAQRLDGLDSDLFHVGK